MAPRVSALRFRHQILLLLGSIIVMVTLAVLLVAVPAVISNEQRLAYDRLRSVNNLKALWLQRELDELQRGLLALATNVSLLDQLRFVTKLLPMGGGDPALLRRLRDGDRGDDPLAGDKLSLMWRAYDQVRPNFLYIDSSYPGSQMLLVRPADGLVLFSLHDSPLLLRSLPAAVGESLLVRCYRRALDNPGRVVFEDFTRPEGRDLAPARGCAATTVGSDREPLAVLLHQFSGELVNAIMTSRQGLGDSGESYLVGKDKLLRTESRFFGSDSVLQQFDDNRAVREGLSGFGGTDAMRDYRGRQVFVVWQPVAVDEIRWSVISKIDEDEVYEELRDNAAQLVLFLWLGVGALFVIAYWFARGTERPLLALLKTSRQLAEGNYAATVYEQAGSRELTDLLKTFRSMALQIRERTAALDQARSRAEQATAEAERANEAKTEFLSRMSHELRTPLNGVLGYTQILKRDATLGSRQRETLQAIESCGQHLLELINDVLDLSRIESGRLELHLEPCITRQLLDRVAAVVRSRAMEKGLEFVVDVEAVPDVIVTDAMKLRQILINLLGNAIKFTHRGFVRLRVTPVAGACQLVFSVSDSGVGIDPRHFDDIFSPFGQTAEGRKQGGTGLGLAISQRLCNALGCELEVHSTVGEGTTFSFSLPYLEADRRDHAAVQSQEHLPRLAPGQREDVIVADDNQANRDILVHLLQAAGFNTREATSGREVLQLLEDQPCDLVLMDLRMPDMDGLQATQAIRARPEWGQVHVIAVSATVQPEVVAGAEAAGCEEFLAKPVQVPELFGVIRRVTGLAFAGDQVPPPAPLQEAGALAALDINALRRLLPQLEAAARLGDVALARGLLAELRQALGSTAPPVRKVEAMLDAFNLVQLGEYCGRLRQELEEPALG